MTYIQLTQAMIEKIQGAADLDALITILGEASDWVLQWLKDGNSDAVEHFRREIMDVPDLHPHYAYETLSHAFQRAPTHPVTNKPEGTRIVAIPFHLEIQDHPVSGEYSLEKSYDGLGIDKQAVIASLYESGALMAGRDQLFLIDRPVTFDELPPTLLGWHEVFRTLFAGYMYGDPAPWPFPMKPFGAEVVEPGGVVIYLLGIAVSPRAASAPPLYSRSWWGSASYDRWLSRWDTCQSHPTHTLNIRAMEPGPVWLMENAEVANALHRAMMAFTLQMPKQSTSNAGRLRAAIRRRGDKQHMVLTMHSAQTKSLGARLQIPRFANPYQINDQIRSIVGGAILKPGSPLEERHRPRVVRLSVPTTGPRLR